MHPRCASADLAAVDLESRAWLERLRAEGPVRDEAIARLHGLLLRAARFEVARRRASLWQLGAAELDDLAVQSADDALLAVLTKLDEFRGASRFTTWAYKFAVLETAVKLRRRPWQERETVVAATQWFGFADLRSSVQAETEQRELLGAVARAVQTELTPHQREILLAVALGDVPIDVLAQRLATTRGALYKTIHDARIKLRRRLAREGYELDVPGSAT